MAQRHFLHRHTSIVPESEARLLHFAESVDWGKRLEAAQTRINNERAQKLANADNVSDRLNAN
ncbi:hypothetical protein FJZ27_05030, partial [Candidatus Peribacteria bacterium]|nr:hypothetical protein [Candidatus Peribacteria bacterium]